MQKWSFPLAVTQIAVVLSVQIMTERLFFLPCCRALISWYANSRLCQIFARKARCVLSVQFPLLVSHMAPTMKYNRIPQIMSLIFQLALPWTNKENSNQANYFMVCANKGGIISSTVCVISCRKKNTDHNQWRRSITGCTKDGVLRNQIPHRAQNQHSVKIWTDYLKIWIAAWKNWVSVQGGRHVVPRMGWRWAWQTLNNNYTDFTDRICIQVTAWAAVQSCWTTTDVCMTFILTRSSRKQNRKHACVGHDWESCL